MQKSGKRSGALLAEWSSHMCSRQLMDLYTAQKKIKKAEKKSKKAEKKQNATFFFFLSVTDILPTW